MGAILDAARAAVAAVTHDQVVDLLAAEDREREYRRHMRQRRGGGTVGQCGGCRRFIRSVGELCACGFQNDLRGRRNHGGHR